MEDIYARDEVMGGTPKNHPKLNRMVHYIPSSYWESPIYGHLQWIYTMK